MKFFQLSAPWDSAGNNPYPWVDSADGLFGPDGLHKLRPLYDNWTPPRLFLSAAAPLVDAYCCPGGYFLFSGSAQAVLADALERMVEWLPTHVAGLGEFFLVHPLRSCSLGPRSSYRRNEGSRNITQIDVYDFEPGEVGDTAIFYPAQPHDSAAAIAGFCCGTVIVTELPALLWQSSGMRGIRFEPVPGADQVPRPASA